MELVVINNEKAIINNHHNTWYSQQ